MHARIDGRDVKLLTRTGLDWSHRYRRTIEALGSFKVKSAYLDGELCALNADGVPVFRPFYLPRASLLAVPEVCAARKKQWLCDKPTRNGHLR